MAKSKLRVALETVAKIEGKSDRAKARFTTIADAIRAEGVAGKQWRRTSGGFYCDDPCVDYVYIAGKAVKTENNTWAYFTNATERSIAIRFHDTHIVTLHHDGAVELASEYTSMTTGSRWHAYGVSASASPTWGGVSIDGIWVPFKLGIGVKSYPRDAGDAVPHLDLLLLGCRAGDTAACDRAVLLLRKAGFRALARIIASLRGKQWGGRPRATRWEWRDAGESLGDGRWLGDFESASRVRVMSTRDIALSGCPDDARELSVDGTTYTVIDGFTGEPVGGWDDWVSRRTKAA